jgi:hypothetical protein
MRNTHASQRPIEVPFGIETSFSSERVSSGRTHLKVDSRLFEGTSREGYASGIPIVRRNL